MLIKDFSLLTMYRLKGAGGFRQIGTFIQRNRILPNKICFLSLLTIFYPTFLIIPRLFLIRCHINICKLIYKTSQICSISWLRPWLRRMGGLRGSGPSSGESSGSGRRVPWGATTQSIARVTGTRPGTVKTSDYTEWCCDNDNWSCNNIIQTICL